MIRNYQIIITLLAFNISVETQAAATPLFQDEKPLKLVLETDMAALVSDKSDNPEYTTGRLISYLEDQKIDFYEIKVRARGKTRRLYDLCNFPPLKINFKKSEVKNTVFEGQDKLKLVIQCKDEVGFRNYLLEEYMIYKVYNQLTEQSYRVRLVEIIIKDTKRTMSAMSF